MTDEKKKYFLHIQHLVSNKEKVGHINTRSISATINALGRIGWHAVTCRLARPTDKQNFENQTLRVIRLG